MIAPSEALARIVGGAHLSCNETEDLFGLLMDGALSEPMKAALLVGLAAKGETSDEIAGAAAAMRGRVISVGASDPDIIDTCGTGGDGKGTFNISTAAAIVAAACGASVAKHGNRSISSRSGSADVLDALGVEIQVDPEVAAETLDRIGITFLFAPKLHPAMREVMPVRKALGIRTIFNILGPLTNPAGAKRQLLGVFSRPLVETVADVLRQLGSEHALVVHGSDGLDEMTTTGETDVAELRDGRVRSYRISPEDVGLPRVSAQDLAGGTPEENAALMLRILEGEPGPLADITMLNAGAALYVAGKVENLASGVECARGSLASGTALAKLAQLRQPVGDRR